MNFVIYFGSGFFWKQGEYINKNTGEKWKYKTEYFPPNSVTLTESRAVQTNFTIFCSLQEARDALNKANRYMEGRGDAIQSSCQAMIKRLKSLNPVEFEPEPVKAQQIEMFNNQNKLFL